MSENFVEREAVSSYLVQWLELNTEKKIGDAKPPDATAPGQEPTLPYGVLYTIGTLTDGPWGDPDVDLEIVVQITCVGKDRRQTQAMSDLVRQVFVGRDSEGNYLYPMDPEGFAITRRWPSGLGAIVRPERLFQSPDTYRVKVVPQ